MDIDEQLTHLADLFERGLLTADEFQAAKARVLSAGVVPDAVEGDAGTVTSDRAREVSTAPDVSPPVETGEPSKGKSAGGTWIVVSIVAIVGLVLVGVGIAQQSDKAEAGGGGDALIESSTDQDPSSGDPNAAKVLYFIDFAEATSPGISTRQPIGKWADQAFVTCSSATLSGKHVHDIGAIWSGVRENDPDSTTEQVALDVRAITFALANHCPVTEANTMAAFSAFQIPEGEFSSSPTPEAESASEEDDASQDVEMGSPVIDGAGTTVPVTITNATDEAMEYNVGIAVLDADGEDLDFAPAIENDLSRDSAIEPGESVKAEAWFMDEFPSDARFEVIATRRPA